MDYQEQIAKILEESKSEIEQKTKEALKEKIISSLNWSLGNEISEIVKKVVKEEMEEDIKNEVINCKQDILDAIKPVFVQIGALVATNMQLKVEDSFKNSWKSDDIIKKILG